MCETVALQSALDLLRKPGDIMASRIDRVLETARSRLHRMPAGAVPAALERGAVLVDIRPQAQREREGAVPAALLIERNVLEWRCDPSSEHRDPRIDGRERQLILMCNEGYQSSLAAATLHELGLTSATDLDGGFQAWRAAGLPVEPLRD